MWQSLLSSVFNDQVSRTVRRGLEVGGALTDLSDLVLGEGREHGNFIETVEELGREHRLDDAHHLMAHLHR
jgi:hypothetical protein